MVRHARRLTARDSCSSRAWARGRVGAVRYCPDLRHGCSPRARTRPIDAAECQQCWLERSSRPGRPSARGGSEMSNRPPNQHRPWAILPLPPMPPTSSSGKASRATAEPSAAPGPYRTGDGGTRGRQRPDAGDGANAAQPKPGISFEVRLRKEFGVSVDWLIFGTIDWLNFGTAAGMPKNDPRPLRPDGTPELVAQAPGCNRDRLKGHRNGSPRPPKLCSAVTRPRVNFGFLAAHQLAGAIWPRAPQLVRHLPAAKRSAVRRARLRLASLRY